MLPVWCLYVWLLCNGYTRDTLILSIYTCYALPLLYCLTLYIPCYCSRVIFCFLPCPYVDALTHFILQYFAFKMLLLFQCINACILSLRVLNGLICGLYYVCGVFQDRCTYIAMFLCSFSVPGGLLAVSLFQIHCNTTQTKTNTKKI